MLGGTESIECPDGSIAREHVCGSYISRVVDSTGPSPFPHTRIYRHTHIFTLTNVPPRRSTSDVEKSKIEKISGDSPERADGVPKLADDDVFREALSMLLSSRVDTKSNIK